MKNYKFIVHHDLEINKEGAKPLSSAIGVPGHAYVEIQNTIDGTSKTFGFYKRGCDADDERLSYAKDYQQKYPKEKTLFSKAFLISQEAAGKIEAYTAKCQPGVVKLVQGDPEASYNVFMNNCTDFVNRLFKLTGMHGLYSWHLTSEEVSQIPGIIRPHVIDKMGPGDKPQIVQGFSIEEVANKYNIPTSLVTKKKSDNSIPIMEVALLQEAADILRYVIAPNPALSEYAQSHKIASEGEEELLQEKSPEKTTSKDMDKDAEYQVHLGGNKAINDLLSDPAKLAAYQQQSMQLAVQGLSEADAVIPGISSKALQEARQVQKDHGDVFASMFPSGGEMRKARQEAAVIAADAERILSEALEQVDLGEPSSSSSAARTQQQPVTVSRETVESTTDFVNNILALSTISDQNTQEAESIIQGSMGNMFQTPDMQDFFSDAFNTGMMGQFFDPNE